MCRSREEIQKRVRERAEGRASYRAMISDSSVNITPSSPPTHTHTTRNLGWKAGPPTRCSYSLISGRVEEACVDVYSDNREASVCVLSLSTCCESLSSFALGLVVQSFSVALSWTYVALAWWCKQQSGAEGKFPSCSFKIIFLLHVISSISTPWWASSGNSPLFHFLPM